MIIINELHYYEFPCKLPHSQEKRYYERIVKKMKHRKRKGKGK